MKKHRHRWSKWVDSQSPGWEFRFTKCRGYCFNVQSRKKKGWAGTLGGHLKPHENPPSKIILTEKGSKRFAKLMKKPAKPTKALKRLMGRKT